MLKGTKLKTKKGYRRKPKKASLASYEGLEGEWLGWLEVANRYEVKVPLQDRGDIRHDIMVELYQARQRDKKPLPLLRAYRIASLMVALYWREVNKPLALVCVKGGTAKKPDHANCQFQQKPSKCSECPFRARRPIISLESELEIGEGDTIALKETVADDTAIDLEAWQEAKTFLLGCPMRLIQIARKRRDGIPLNDTDQRYFTRQRQKELNRYQLTLM